VGKQHSLSIAIAAGVCASMLILAGCNQQPAAQDQANAPASSATAAGQQQAAAYTPPTADQLYQMVAPIALFPDKLVAQVLAGATYPDQITAAENLVTQNPNLKGDLLQADVQPQSWDPSVKGLTQFPSVLSQMAQNIQWTTALGEAYVNDPSDVLNAIQVMRQRARGQGNLQSSAQQAINVQPVQQVQASEEASGEVVSSDAPPVYSGPAVVPAPQQIIQIEPAQPDAVYVPSYNPQTVYGGDVPVYPSYEYEQPTYTTGEVVAVGAVAFGAAIIVGSLFDHHHDHDYGGGGWHSWGMNWGGGYNGGGGGGYGGGGGGWHRPAVVYNNQTYVSNSTTVVNRYTNITNNNVTNNRYVNNGTVNNNNSVNNNYINNNRTINNNNTNSNVTNNYANNHNQFNRNVTNNVTNNNNHPPAQPMSMPNFARAGYPSAPVPHAAAAPEQHPVAPTRLTEVPHNAPNVAHPQPAEVAQHPGVAPRPQENFRQPTPQPAQRPVPQQEHAQAAFRPAPQEQPHPQPAPRPAPQQEHPQPAFHPAPQEQARPQPAPRPEPAPRPAPQQERPQPAFHPAPAPAPAPRPEPRPQPQPQAHPAPAPHQAPPPPKKKDESHN
jgi:hypothetical protein